MKVETFGSRDPERLAETINGFIADKKVIDVKYCITPETADFDAWHAALVMYEDVSA